MSSSVTPHLDPALVSDCHEHGFTSVPQISTPEELTLLRSVFERLFAQCAGRREGAQYDMLGHDGEGAEQRLPTILNPLNYAPELRRLRCRDHAAVIARALLGPGATATFEHAILKPPRQGAATPWHQDEASGDDFGFPYPRLSIWMPLQEATIDNGCMWFSPGSHRLGVLRHRSPDNDPRVHALECVGTFNAGQAVACPIPAGAATAHLGRTLHFAGPNRSDGPRCAYIFTFEVPAERPRERRQFEWNTGKQPANQLRKRQWQRRGGILVEAARTLRAGVPWRRAASRLLFELRRALRGSGA
jgi:hypothetical protein